METTTTRNSAETSRAPLLHTRPTRAAHRRRGVSACGQASACAVGVAHGVTSTSLPPPGAEGRHDTGAPASSGKLPQHPQLHLLRSSPAFLPLVPRSAALCRRPLACAAPGRAARRHAARPTQRQTQSAAREKSARVSTRTLGNRWRRLRPPPLAPFPSFDPRPQPPPPSAHARARAGAGAQLADTRASSEQTARPSSVNTAEPCHAAPRSRCCVLTSVSACAHPLRQTRAGEGWRAQVEHAEKRMSDGCNARPSSRHTPDEGASTPASVPLVLASVGLCMRASADAAAAAGEREARERRSEERDTRATHARTLSRTSDGPSEASRATPSALPLSFVVSTAPPRPRSQPQPALPTTTASTSRGAATQATQREADRQSEGESSLSAQEANARVPPFLLSLPRVVPPPRGCRRRPRRRRHDHARGRAHATPTRARRTNRHAGGVRSVRASVPVRLPPPRARSGLCARSPGDAPPPRLRASASAARRATRARAPHCAPKRHRALNQRAQNTPHTLAHHQAHQITLCCAIPCKLVCIRMLV